MGLSSYCLTPLQYHFLGGRGQPRLPRLVLWASPCHFVPCVHTNMHPFQLHKDHNFSPTSVPPWSRPLSHLLDICADHFAVFP